MDNPQVDRYLAAVGARLRTLSAVQRDEELRELRQHLEALVAGHRAQGRGEEEAVAEALRQFGHAEQLGRQLHEAASGHPPRLWPWVVAYLSLVVLIFGALATANDKPTDFPHEVGGQLLLALVLPAGMLIIRTAAYLRARRAKAWG